MLARFLSVALLCSPTVSARGAAQPLATLLTPPAGGAQVPPPPPVAVEATAPRNPRWAAPLQGPGLDNFYQVSATLYRGAEPTAEGLAELRRRGVKTVLSLRAFHGERDAVAKAGLGYERISFKIWHPEDEDVRRFLAIVGDPARQPVFLHCKRGADRTGTMVAVYRICIEGWSREAAIEEMTRGGYRFNPTLSYLPGYLRRFDTAGCASALARPSVAP